MNDLIELREVYFDIQAMDGTWCKLPYPSHPNGCPNVHKGCLSKRIDFLKISPVGMGFKWYAVIEEFDLANHASIMKERHPDWTERQCRNLLYWQRAVNSRLIQKARKYREEKGEGCLHLGSSITPLLQMPEAHGVDIFETMKKHGIILERGNPSIVRKIMMFGIPTQWDKASKIITSEKDRVPISSIQEIFICPTHGEITEKGIFIRVPSGGLGTGITRHCLKCEFEVKFKERSKDE